MSRMSLTLAPGRAAPGGADPLLERTTFAGLAEHNSGGGPGKGRLEARVGYGFPAFGNRFTATPEIAAGLSGAGRDYSLGCRLARGGDPPDGSALELAVETRRRDAAAHRNIPPEYAIAFRVTSRF